MWVWIVVLIIAFAVCGYIDYKKKKSESKPIGNSSCASINKSNENTEMRCKYLGGFSDVSIDYNVCKLTFYKDEIVMKFTSNKSGSQTSRFIKNADIISGEFVTKEYITQQVGLGKLLVFGWLSLGMDNNKKVTEEYVLTKINYEGKEIAVVLDSTYYSNETLLKKIKEQINK